MWTPPGVLIGLSTAALGLLVAALVVAVLGLGLAAGWLLVVAVAMAGSAALFAHTTRRGKFSAWAGVIHDLELAGTERVLDVGCGRGAVLTAVASAVPQGRATGVDLWRTVDQSGNSEAVTLTNARLAGVADRVEVRTGDMRRLPCPDASFDLVVSSLAVHNVPDAGGREESVREIYRVLAPGGRLRIADIQHGTDYAKVLRELGAADLQVRPLIWRMWFGGPWMATRLVAARKPG